MTSLQKTTKQLGENMGYYINLGSLVSTFYVNTGTDAAPAFSTNIYAQSTYTSSLLQTAGAAILRSQGKVVVSSGRVFRKVQLMASTNAVVNNGTDGVGGLDNAPNNYITGYIELPGLLNDASGGPWSFTRAVGTMSPVARLG